MQRLITIDRRIASISVWAQASGTPVSTVRSRLRRGWSNSDAVFGRGNIAREVPLPFTTIDYLADGARYYNAHASYDAANEHAAGVLYPCVTEIRDPSGAVVREIGIVDVRVVMKRFFREDD